MHWVFAKQPFVAHSAGTGRLVRAESKIPTSFNLALEAHYPDTHRMFYLESGPRCNSQMLRYVLVVPQRMQGIPDSV